MEIIEDTNGVEIVFIENVDGTTLSMTKAVWDELEAAKKASGTLS
jgi:hypothetical protein